MRKKVKKSKRLLVTAVVNVEYPSQSPYSLHHRRQGFARSIMIRLSSWGFESCNTATGAWSDTKKRVDYVLTYSACVSTLRTFDLVNELEAHFLIYCHVRLPLGAFKVAGHAFLVCLVHDFLHEPLSDPHSTSSRAHAEQVAEIIPTGVDPQGLMCIALQPLPYPVAPNVQSTSTKEANIVHELFEREKPVLSPN